MGRYMGSEIVTHGPHFLEYIRNLEEIPEEKEYMRNLLIEKGYEVSELIDTTLSRQTPESVSAEESTPEKEEN